uniref:protein-tyrosine-phosphatase n=1 Tax=Neogobius melanostomus TaxID=47308 RepID=A0A8C6TWU6_9GOBI
MRTNDFDSSSDEDDIKEEELTPFHISWLPLTVVGSSQFLGICALPGCKYKDIRRSLQRDVEELQSQGVQSVFVFCTRGELNKYRVPSLLEAYRQCGFAVHHMPFLDGDAPELEHCCRILEQLRHNLDNNRRTVIQSCRQKGETLGSLPTYDQTLRRTFTARTVDLDPLQNERQLLWRTGTFWINRGLFAAAALSDHDPKQSHRDPEGAQRRRRHPDGQTIQFPSRVSGQAHVVPRDQRRGGREMRVPVTSAFPKI